MFPKYCLLVPALVLVTLSTMADVQGQQQSGSGEKYEIAGMRNLSSFINHVWQENLEIKSAHASLLLAQAKSSAADQPVYNPELELESEKTDISSYSVGINQTIDWSDIRGAKIGLANQELIISQSEFTMVQQRIAMKVLNALAGYDASEKLLSLARKRQSLMQQFNDTTSLRYAAGDIGRLDTLLSSVAFNEAKIQKLNRENELVIKDSILRASSSINLSSWPELQQQYPAPPEKPDTQNLLASLPGLNVSRYRWHAAKAGIELVRSETSANPSVGISGGREDTESLFGFTLSVPIQVRNNYRDEVRAASQLAVQYEQMFLNNRQNALIRIENSINQYRKLFDALQSWVHQGQTDLDEQMQLLNQMWVSGEISATDYLIQAKQNIDTQETVVELSEKLWLAWFEWLEASGTVKQWLSSQNKDAGEIK